MSLKRLQQLIESKSILNYRGKKAVIKDFEKKHGSFEITVDLDGKSTIFTKSTEEHIGLWLANFSEAVFEQEEKVEHAVAIPEKKPDKVEVHPNVFTEKRKQMQTLSEMLLEDIQKVRSDPKYVPQAKQVCNSVNAIVNITKLQILMINKD